MGFAITGVVAGLTGTGILAEYLFEANDCRCRPARFHFTHSGNAARNTIERLLRPRNLDPQTLNPLIARWSWTARPQELRNPQSRGAQLNRRAWRALIASFTPNDRSAITGATKGRTMAGITEEIVAPLDA